MSQTTHISACPLDCFGVCSFKLTLENNQIIELSPNEANPVTGKVICSKGRSHLARMNHPHRILTPLRRTALGWEAISWDDAMAFITEKIQSCLETEGHHSIASYMGGGAAGKLKGTMELFFRHLGGGTVFAGGLCWAAGIEAQTQDFGRVLSHSPEDLLNARSLVLWGKNPADTHFHLLPYINKARKNGCQVILVDPIVSSSSSMASRVIRPLPGTDWALALAVIQRVLAENSETPQAAELIEIQQPKLLQEIKALDSDHLLKICGVSPEDLNVLADAYSFHTPCATYMGYGMQRYESGGASVRLIDLLAVLTGQVGIAGGGANYANKVNSGLFDWSWAEPSKLPDERAFQQGNFGSHLLESHNPPVKLLFIACGNPALQAPASRSITDALKSVETVVVIDHFMTDTAALADIVLPATYFLEEEDIVSSGMWNSTIHYNPRIVPPRGEARSELRIFSELAQRLGLDEFPQLSEFQWLDRLIRPLKEQGLTLEKFQEKGWVPSPNQQTIPWENQVFSTADGQYHPLGPEVIQELLKSAALDKAQGTLPLISFHRRDSINSQHTMDHEATLPQVMLHPITAGRLEILTGDIITLVNDTGELCVIADVDSAVRPEVLAIKQGAWKHIDQSLNDLSPSGVSDLGGQALLNAARVKIIKS